LTGLLASVVIPAFNEERYLAESIESVLAQTYEPVEVIVVDDGSTDATAAIASSFDGVTVLGQPNRGLAAARNAGYDATSGDFISFHDADDLMTPDKLELQIGVLQSDPGCGCVLARQRLLIEEGSELPFWARMETMPVALAGAEGEPPPAPHTMTMVMRRSTFETVGRFDTSLRIAQDVDWVFRAHESGLGIVALEDELLIRRIHGSSLTQDTDASRRELFMAFKKKIERHRVAESRSSP